MPRRRSKDTLIQGGFLPPDQRSRGSSLEEASLSGSVGSLSTSSSLRMRRPEMLNSAADLKTLLYASSDKSKRIAGGRGCHQGDVFNFNVDDTEVAYGLPEWLSQAPFPSVEPPSSSQKQQDVASKVVIGSRLAG